MQSTTRNPFTVAEQASDVRALFIRRTYGHLAAAIAAFVLLEFALFQTALPQQLVPLMSEGMNWLIVLGCFMAVSFVADKLARSKASSSIQYVGLGLFIVAMAFLAMPILLVATMYSSSDVIPMAAIITGLLFGGLTATVFITRADFSFLRTYLVVGFFVALGIIIAGVVFNFSLGLVFSGGMVLLLAASILYTTSNILHEYNPDQHVAASLALFASVIIMFLYILRIVMILSGRD